MEYRLGNSNKIKSRGETKPMCCPSCNKEVAFSLYSNFERKLAVKPELFDLNTIYFLVCPNCANVFSVSEDIAKTIIKGNYMSLGSEELKSLKEFK